MNEAFTHILAFAAGVITLAGALVAFGAWLGREASKALEAEREAIRAIERGEDE